MFGRSPHLASRRGFSLLEVVMAAALAGIALVGALELLRDGMDLGQTIDHRQLLTNYAVSKLEEQLSVAAATWTNGTWSGNFAADGHPQVRFVAVRSDAVASGGIVDRLMHVQVTTYWDANGNNNLDASEDRCNFRTKIGKFATYESLVP